MKELWRPSAPEKTQIYDFKTLVSRKYGLALDGYHDLWQWSVSEPAKFWEEVWHYTAVKAHQPYSKVSRLPLSSSTRDVSQNRFEPIVHTGIRRQCPALPKASLLRRLPSQFC